MKIGFTERGDAGIDLSWYDKCKAGACDGTILITKRLTPDCRAKILDLYNSGLPTILHCTCTGWGGSVFEPNAYKPDEQLASLKQLISDGFPARNAVLRIDPIIPTEEGFRRAKKVVEVAECLGLLPGLRIRISVYDEYAHVKERLTAHGIKPVYADGCKYASGPMLVETAHFLSQFPYGFETCAEPLLTRHAKRGQVVPIGCLSKKDLEIMGLQYDGNYTNPQQRYGCLCLGCKKELLENKRRCPVGCLYCYWCG